MATIRDSDLLYVQRGETPHNWTGLELKALVRATGKDGKLTVGNYLTPNGSTYDGSANLTINVDGSSGIEANKVVVRDEQGSFSANVISANSFVGDGSQLTNAGAVLSDHSGTQRLVTTTLTSGAMVTAATSSDLSFTDTDATLNVGAGIKLLGTTGSATLTGSIDADSYIASDRAGDLSETFRSQKEGISKLVIYNTGRVDTKSTINIATTNSSAINIFPSESIGTASIVLQNNGNATFTGSLTIGGGNIQLNSNGNASFSGTVTANLIVGLKTLTRGNYLTGGNYNGQVAQTWNVDATVSNTGNKVVVRDGSGNFSAGTITASLNGNASTASNADKLDGLDSTQFLRGDIDDTTSGTLTSSKADQAFIAQSNGTSNAWRGRILSKNSSSDRASFLGVYANKAGVFAHNHALSTWQDLYVNTVDATTGGNVRLPATTYVNGHAAVYNSGTWNINVTGSSTNAGYSTNSGYASNSDKCDGLHVHGGRNNEANKIVRTDGNGYAQFGWINTVSGVTNSGIARVYASQDDYIRYCSPDHLANSMTNVVKTAYNTSLNSDSRNSRGVTRLYRREDNSDYSVQTYWSGTRWILYGYNGDNGHGGCQVSYADSAGSASNAGYANSAGSATNAGYANNSGNLQGHTWTSAGKDIRAKEFYAEGWFRNYDANEGVYNEATGGHFYASPGNGVWNLTGNTQNASTSLIFRGTHNGNVEGWIHANGTGWLGILNAAGQWALKSYNPDGHSPNLWFDEEGNETWTGNPGNDEGKIEYHSNRFYIASGGNSTEICRFRRGGSDKAWVANDGNMYLVGGIQSVYNSGTWSINITGSAGSATNAGYAGSAGYANSAGSAPANGGTSSAVTINYNNNSNSTYQMLWGSGNSVYGTGGIYCNPNANYIYASLFVGGLSGNASSATNAGYANSAGSATNASYAGSAGYANSAGSASNAGNANGPNIRFQDIQGGPNNFIYTGWNQTQFNRKSGVGQFNAQNILEVRGSAGGYVMINSEGVVTNRSSSRLWKKDISEPLSYGLNRRSAEATRALPFIEKFKALNFKTFKYDPYAFETSNAISLKESRETECGLIVEDVELVAPELIFDYNPQDPSLDKDYKTINNWEEVKAERQEKFDNHTYDPSMRGIQEPRLFLWTSMIVQGLLKSVDQMHDVLFTEEGEFKLKQRLSFDASAIVNAEDDAAAAAAGVEINGIYHNNGQVRIRLQ